MLRLPLAGELNRRVTISGFRTEPVGTNDAKTETPYISEVWGKVEVVGGSTYWGSVQVDSVVTHRIWVRWTKGLTAPADLGHITRLVVGGVEYRVRRVTDANDAHRFTMMEAEEVGSL